MFLAVVIPAYHEDSLFKTLSSLNHCRIPPNREVITIVVINQPSNASDKLTQFHLNQIHELQIRRNKYAFPLHIIKKLNVSPKKAGVGTARKFGMDEATKMAENIVCLDADCSVSENYMEAWCRFFENNSFDAGIVNFEHLWNGLNAEHKKAIIRYELHLRYYYNAQKWCGYPHAMQPIGSCMGVRSKFYKKIGGMNTRKAGEDFYFLQKCTLHGNLIHFSDATVYPSARVSGRVPFGTGRAITDQLESGNPFLTYNWKTLEIMKDLIIRIKSLHLKNKRELELPQIWQGFSIFDKWSDIIEKTVIHSRDQVHFQMRLFSWFNPFRFMKAINFLSQDLPRRPVSGEVVNLLCELKLPEAKTPGEQLQIIRTLDHHLNLMESCPDGK